MIGIPQTHFHQGLADRRYLSSIIADGAPYLLRRAPVIFAVSASTSSVASFCMQIFFQHAAMPVAGVLTQADIGNNQNVGHSFLMLWTACWTIAVFGKSSRRHLSFFAGMPKSKTAGMPSS